MAVLQINIRWICFRSNIVHVGVGDIVVKITTASTVVATIPVTLICGGYMVVGVDTGGILPSDTVLPVVFLVSNDDVIGVPMMDPLAPPLQSKIRVLLPWGLRILLVGSCVVYSS